LPKIQQHSDDARATSAGRTGENRICAVEHECVRQQRSTIQVYNMLANEAPAALTGASEHHHFPEHRAGPWP
jgi:hypothetical protein